MVQKHPKLLSYAYLLSIITIVYNLLEGGISTYFGASDDTLALFGFGLDSFVEVLSGVGIAHMIYRMRRSEISDAKCTKTCFYLSFILLISSGLYELWQVPYVDALGSLGIAWYAFKEGREAFENARLKRLGCSDSCC